METKQLQYYDLVQINNACMQESIKAQAMGKIITIVKYYYAKILYY